MTDANFECNEEGINLQAMDNSHVALVSVALQASGFAKYRCDRPMPLGVNLGSLTKVLKCAKDDDKCTLKAADEADVLNMVYEAASSDRIAEYEMKLMEIDADTLQIPDTEYEARVTLPSAEFARIVRDLSALGESVRIEVSKEGVRFASEGEAANGNVLLKQTEGIIEGARIVANNDDDDDDAPIEVKDEDSDDGSVKVKKEKGAKKEKKEKKVDDDVEMADDDDEVEEFKPQVDDDEDDQLEEEDEDEETDSKKRKKKANGSSQPAKKAKTSKRGKKGKDDDDENANAVKIELNSHVSLTFSLKYLVNFAKSATLGKRVQLMMSNDVPLLVSYDFGQGYIRYYLAPKIGDD